MYSRKFLIIRKFQGVKIFLDYFISDVFIKYKFKEVLSLFKILNYNSLNFNLNSLRKYL